MKQLHSRVALTLWSRCTCLACNSSLASVIEGFCENGHLCPYDIICLVVLICLAFIWVILIIFKVICNVLVQQKWSLGLYARQKCLVKHVVTSKLYNHHSQMGSCNAAHRSSYRKNDWRTIRLFSVHTFISHVGCLSSCISPLSSATLMGMFLFLFFSNCPKHIKRSNKVSTYT